MTDNLKKANELVLEFLGDPSNYSSNPASVRRLETHSAWIFLASPYVYKVKKTVNLGFLDYSTLTRRKGVLERELVLNQRFSEGVYLDIRPLWRRGSQLSWERNGGKVVEYVLVMKRLGAGFFADRLLQRHQLSVQQIHRLSNFLISFYKSASSSFHISRWGKLNKLRLSTDENFRQTRSFLGEWLPESAWRCLRRYTMRFLDHHHELLDERVRQGWIRDCHGDLRLEHIHMTSGDIQIIDCVEFNDRLRFLDVANDLAFLAMDLDVHGRPDLSRQLVREVSSGLGDKDMVRLMDFYKCYRAIVRAKIECMQSAMIPGQKQFASRQHEVRARHLFQWALRYAVLGSKPLIIVVMGGIATGKSTVAKALGERLGVNVFSSDWVRKELAGLPMTHRSPPSVRAKIYRPGMTRKVYGELIRLALRECRWEHSVVLDATFGRKELRGQLWRESQTAGIDVHFLELKCSKKEVRQRLKTRAFDSGVVSDARLEDLAVLDARYEPPGHWKKGEGIRICSEDSLEELVDQCLEKISTIRS